jgi:hypothetical protein
MNQINPTGDACAENGIGETGEGSSLEFLVPGFRLLGNSL